MGNSASMPSNSPSPVSKQKSPVKNERTPQTTAPRKGQQFQEVQLAPPVEDKRNSESRASPSTNSSSLPSDNASSRNTMSSRNTSSGNDNASSRNSGNEAATTCEGDEIVFETFVRDGKEFQCMYTGGMRFYLDDWHSKQWQPFPQRWYKEGKFVNANVLNDTQPAKQQTTASNNTQNKSDQRTEQPVETRKDDREGIISHPKRGNIRTYLFKEKHYIHCFYDATTGEWMRLPLGWELRHALVKEMVDQVEEALPNWKNRPHILASLRACNYNPDECISLYLHLENDVWLTAPKTSQEENTLKNKNFEIKELENKVKQLETEVRNEGNLRKEAENQVMILQEKLSTLEAKSGMAVAQVEAMQQTRPRTARPKTPQAQKTVIEERFPVEDLDELNLKTTEIHKSHSQLKHTVERQLDIFATTVRQVNEAFLKLSKVDNSHMAELEEIKSLYQKECLQRKLLYNKLQELRGNIRVFCRPRKDKNVQNCLDFSTENELVCSNKDGNKKSFSFDKVYNTNCSQEEVFADTKPVITSCADGYNICLMAYGQTGSGKTFTMMGTDSNPGINIRALSELLSVCAERAETKEYNLKLSMVEIYNETVIDLLAANSKTVELRAAGNNFRIPGLTELDITTESEIKEAMEMGDKNRSVASTKMNSTSSRSHLVLMLTIEGKDKINGSISKGVLTLCDLAGSERIGKTEASGQRLIEAAAINKSLSALGQVFSALRTSQMHVPYRNSKLTQILRPCLGGDAKACVFVNISPDVNNYPETCNTLEFGANARQVALGQVKQNIKKGRGGSGD
ncbi:uncharacterized protein LOC126826649 isoform X1 [Patella vulgata]|uniref:uncharacterized protein LOC126826649 isoform X1 n=2 Tax=Patella vulgata TaxID=6465 RepID=UPI0021800A10|nr:uncharacterized protein LOC126826649 isoform X1 [Patella vulgata]